MYHSNCTYYSTYYRYGYQGQFAEKDPETGLNSFETRMYDSRIGRWLTTDPAGQYWSPYMGMGNNGTNRIDNNGKTDFRTEDGIIHTINDGIQISYDIMSNDYEVLEFAYNADKTKDKSQYFQYYKIINPGSTGYWIAVDTRSNENSTIWAYSAKRDNFSENSNKCNKFLYDMYASHGIVPKIGNRAPMTGEWAKSNPKITNVYKTDIKDFRLGNIVAGYHLYHDEEGNVSAAGHVTIITFIDKYGSLFTTGAGGDNIVTNNWGINAITNAIKYDKNMINDEPFYYPVSVWSPTPVINPQK